MMPSFLTLHRLLPASLAGTAPLLAALYSHFEGTATGPRRNGHGRSSSPRRWRRSSTSSSSSSSSARDDHDQNSIVTSLLESLGVSPALSRSILEALPNGEDSRRSSMGEAEQWMQRIAAELGGGDAIGGPGTARGVGGSGPAYNTRSRSRRGGLGRGTSRRRGSEEQQGEEEESLASQMIRTILGRMGA
ncbi:hypothetical protein BDZ90DRAFT_195767 [Jaminaea rosea]|uniref:CUE domain-containing protein n=1 Tax=Jaminaea rosea TaxID=1569628 RepID=A0A316URK6_9BASI|nr:hypothetical protein BDZ90DRAFT_195767 [Jaminaea rosea]PWN26951.1 hypothetical protein BDZ90DRAFT_195767 [Jaminaea rosea]